MIILKVTKKQSFTLSLEDTFLEKPQGGSNHDLHVQIDQISNIINMTKNQISKYRNFPCYLRKFSEHSQETFAF